jgi:type II secretory pathway pseudopilin PulG
MHRPRRATGEAGETLVELLVTVTIMGIAVVGLVTGIGTAIRLSGTHRTQASTGLVLVTAAEAVKGFSAPSAPDTCSPTLKDDYAPALTGLTSLPAGWSSSNLSITEVTCPSVNGLVLPKVTVKATSPNGEATESVDVVRASVR